MEEDQHKQSVSQKRDSVHEGGHNDSQALDGRDGPQWTDYSERSEGLKVGTLASHDHAEEATHDDGKIENVPSISDVGTFVQDEA